MNPARPAPDPLRPHPRQRLPRRVLLGGLLLLLGAPLLLPSALVAPARADEADPAAEEGKADEAPPPTEAARKHAIKGLKSKLRRISISPRASEKTAEALKHLEALAALGGTEAGRAAMEAVPHPAPEVRDAAFDLIEREHDKGFVRPLVVLLEDKRFRRDADAKRRIVHALAVVAHPDAIEPLSDLIRFDEDPEVVAETADALTAFASEKVPLRRPAVKRLVDLYTSIWNLKESVRQDHKDKVMKREAEDRYEVYGKNLRHALQVLTGVQLTRPQEWREWWNDNKKRPKWGRHSIMPENRRER